jgi:hypothetical protein
VGPVHEIGYPRLLRRDAYSQQKEIPDNFSSSLRRLVKSSMACCSFSRAFHDSHDFDGPAMPDESRIDFRTSQLDVSGFRRGTGI